MELLMNVTTYVIVFVPTDNVDLIGAIRRLIAEPGPDGNIQQYDKEYEIALLEKRQEYAGCWISLARSLRYPKTRTAPRRISWDASAGNFRCIALLR